MNKMLGRVFSFVSREDSIADACALSRDILNVNRGSLSMSIYKSINLHDVLEILSQVRPSDWSEIREIEDLHNSLFQRMFLKRRKHIFMQDTRDVYTLCVKETE